MPTDRHQRRSTTNGFSVAISAFNECTRLHGNRGVGTSQRIGHPQRDTEIANRTHCSLLSSLSLSLLLLQLFGSTSLSASSVYSARKIHRSGKMLGQTVKWRQLELRFDLSSMPFDDDSRTSFESEVVVILATSEQQRPASAS